MDPSGVGEPLVVGEGPGGAVADEGAGQAQAGAVLAHRVGIRVDARDLLLGQGMAAELQEHHELADPTARGRLGEGRGDLVGPERLECVEVEVGAAPVARDDRAEHPALLVGAAVAGVDRSEQRSGRRLDPGVLDHTHRRTVLRGASADLRAQWLGRTREASAASWG